MKDLSYEINLEDCNNVMQLASDKGYEMFVIEGGLMDDIMIVDNKDIRVGRAKPREYIIIRAKFLNTWSSGLVMTMTDNEELADEFYNEWAELWDEKEKEYV